MPGRMRVGVLVEALAALQAQSPQRDLVGNVRVASRAEQDRVLAAQRIQAVGEHHDTVGAVAVAAPAEVLKLEAHVPTGVRCGEGLQHLLAGRVPLLADAIAGNGGDLVDLQAVCAVHRPRQAVNSPLSRRVWAAP